MSGPAQFKLHRRQGQVFLRFEREERELPVRVLWARPLTQRGRHISFLDEHKKEVAMVDGPDCLDPESAQIVAEELEQRYLLPQIMRVYKTSAEYGTRYWDVETDLGRRAFAMRDPYKNVIRVSEDRVVLRDTIGNSYEIVSLAGLDKRSRNEVQKVL